MKVIWPGRAGARIQNTGFAAIRLVGDLMYADILNMSGKVKAEHIP